VKRRFARANTVFVLVCLLGRPASLPAAQIAPPASRPAPNNELDAFMAKVLEKREINRQTLEQYVLDEVEQVDVLGPSRMPVYRQKREFTWYVRDGLHVRSPVRFDGVAVGERARTEYEEEWAMRERGRLARKAEKERGEGGKAADAPAAAQDAPEAGPAGSTPIPTPRFVSEAYFMDFKFEPGNYYLVGREQLEGQTVLRIEYYPTRMFNDNDDDERRDRKREPRRQNQREREIEQRIERQMNKTALVTLWVDPAEHQIVRYTFDNVWMDFLPGGWLVKVDDIKASMTMGQPFPGVWLPREINIHAGVTLASGPLEAAYARRFSDYKQADVATKIRVPKLEARSSPCCAAAAEHAASGPFVAAADDLADAPDGSAADRQDVIAEIRVHGNAYLKDEEVIRLAGIAVGQSLDQNGVGAIEQRLTSSGFFDTVEVRKRYRSLDAAGDVAIVLLVHERPGQKAELATEPPSPWPWSRVKSRVMFLPILGYDDGYGFTYGARISTVDLLGAGERLSVPLTWGGTRRAALEFERTFKRGPLTRIESTYGISQRENPRFEIDDRRVEWTARAERSFARVVRAGIATSQGTVAFDQLDDRTWTLGADVALDTRGDPAFPRNAVYLGAGWNALHVRRLEEPINRWTTDARGYVGVIRQAVLAGRVQYSSADRTLPPYERYLLGGASTLRGFDAGAFAGDRMFVSSAELRVPITSVLSGAKLGVTAFMDAGKAWDVGQRLEDAAWHRGVGGGLFLIATIVRLNLDVAHGLKDGDTRVHFAAGFAF
jgi:surface antigen Omp85-like protein/surface antigen-like variable number repeat protein